MESNNESYFCKLADHDIDMFIIQNCNDILQLSDDSSTTATTSQCNTNSNTEKLTPQEGDDLQSSTDLPDASSPSYSNDLYDLEIFPPQSTIYQVQSFLGNIDTLSTAYSNNDGEIENPYPHQLQSSGGIQSALSPTCFSSNSETFPLQENNNLQSLTVDHNDPSTAYCDVSFDLEIFSPQSSNRIQSVLDNIDSLSTTYSSNDDVTEICHQLSENHLQSPVSIENPPLPCYSNNTETFSPQESSNLQSVTIHHNAPPPGSNGQYYIGNNIDTLSTTYTSNDDEKENFDPRNNRQLPTPSNKKKNKKEKLQSQDNNQLESLDDSDNKENKLQCKYCKKTFDYMSGLTVHIRTHTGELPFKCEVCGRGFKQKIHMQNHLVTHSVREKPCELCGEIFTQKADLKKHLLSHAGEEGPFSCKCGETFKSSKDLQYHIHTDQCKIVCLEV